jgi:hypothetical protein
VFIWTLLIAAWGSHQAVAGYIVRDFYIEITGGAVINMTTNAIYPDSPTSSENLTELFEGASDLFDNYGSRIRGYIEAPQTGSFIFWVASDDASQLWLSTDSNPANKRMIAFVTDHTSARQYNKYVSQESTNISLTKGQNYYIEVLHKENTGGDNISVGWKWPEPDGRLQRPIPAYYLEPYFPTNTTLAITTQPASTLAEEMTKVVLFVNVDAPTPPTFQWYKNDALMPDEILSSLVFDKVPLTDSDSKYYVRINNSTNSETVILTVFQDTTAPGLVSVDTLGYDTLLQVVFSEPVTPATATNAANYTLDSGIVVTNAVMMDEVTVRLRTSKISPATEHTLTVNGVQDYASTTPNSMVNVNMTFGALAGFVTDKIFTGVSGGVVSSLTAAARFPNNPNVITNLTSFESPSGYADNYGQLIQGYLVPTTTGDYTFAVAADDAADVYLSADDNPSNKALILRQNTYAGVRVYTNNVTEQQTAAPIHLVAGRRYYIELLHKESGGDDNLALAWQLGGGNIANGTEPIPGANLVSYVTPTVPLAITNQPQNQTVVVFRNATFSANVTGNPGQTGVQWYRNGLPIPGANGLSYTLNNVTTNDQDAVFYVLVTNLAYSITSSNVVLSVNTDNVPPTLAAAGSLDGTTVAVSFNEAIEPASATNKANYAIASTTVTGVTLNPDGKTVVLALSPKAPNNFTVTVNNVTDLAGNPVTTNSTVQGNSLNLTLVNIDNSQDYSLTYAGDITMVAGGADIWGNSDQFAFAYLQVTGDFDYRLDVKSVQNVNAAAKTGLMVRKTLDPGSRHAIWSATPQTGRNNMEFYGRIVTDGVSADINAAISPALYPNTWLRLQRVGSIFNAFYSSNGVNWVRVPTSWDTSTSTDGPLPDTVYLGIATCSLSTSATTTAVVSDFGVVPQIPVAITNQPPANLLWVENRTYTIPVGATGDPIKYQWLKNGTNIPSATGASYTVALASAADAGTYSVRVYNDVSSVTSSNCVVTISNDRVPPTLASAMSYDGLSVGVTFSEILDPPSATNKANYSVTGATINDATLSADGKTVVLVLASKAPDSFTVTVSNVKDPSQNPIVAGSTVQGTVLNMTLADIATGQEFSATYAGNTATIVAGGADVWGNADAFVYVYFQVTGDFDYRLDVQSVQNTHVSAKSGLMVRETLEPGSRYAIWSATPQTGRNRMEFYGRVVTDGASADINAAISPALYPNTWLRLQRVGSVFNAFYSSNGVNWVRVPTSWDTSTSTDGPLPDTVYLGIATCSHSTSATTTAVVSDLGVTPQMPVAITNQPPASIASLENASLAIAVGTTGDPIQYQWLKDGTNISGAIAASYTVAVVTPADAGTYSVRVYNDIGSALSSNCVVTVLSDHIAPTLAIAGSFDGLSVSVTFSELVDPASATNKANYTVTGASIAGAALAADGKTVVLTLSSKAPDHFTVTVSNVKDLATNPIAASSTAEGDVQNLVVQNINNTQSFAVTYAGNIATISAGGADTWGTFDNFLYAYLQVTGDFDYSMDVQAISNVNEWSRSGLMARQTLTSSSRHVYATVNTPTGRNCYQFIYRPVSEQASYDLVSTNLPPASFPNSWVRLKRTGSVFQAYHSTDGVDWLEYATYDSATSSQGALPSTLYLGIATCSHNSASNTTAVVSNFRSVAQPSVEPPILAISKSAGTVILSWPTAQTEGFVLQSADSLTPPISWSLVTNTDIISGSNHTVTVPMTGEKRFFELKK